MKRGADIGDFLKPLADNPLQSWITNRLQVADVLEWCLAQMGRSEVWQTSFSISEEFLRRLYFIKKSHAVSEITLVLDHKATNKTLKLWAFLAQVFDKTYLADNHSKVILIRSERGEVCSIITSQNLTRGNRMESAIVATDKQVFATLHNQLQDIINEESVSLNELFGERIAAD